MITIYKYRVELTEKQTISLPKNCAILDFNSQGVAGMQSDLYLWCLINTTEKKETRTFHVYGTGHEIPDNSKLKYIKTAHSVTGYVWHLFEEVN